MKRMSSMQRPTLELKQSMTKLYIGIPDNISYKKPFTYTVPKFTLFYYQFATRKIKYKNLFYLGVAWGAEEAGKYCK